MTADRGDVVQPGAGPALRLEGLDGVRALAVLLVMLMHTGVAGFGWIGVQIFFVLSGFLISRILLRDRSAALGLYLRRFYGRRVLRIFPAYYAYLLVLALLVAVAGLAQGRVALGQLPYALTYTYDFFHASSSFVHTRLLAHFWSLAVEEQFYLAWPLVLYFVPARALRAFLLCLIAGGPILRLAGLLAWQAAGACGDDVPLVVYVLPTSHLDAFATGALLAVADLGVTRRGFLLALALAAGGAAAFKVVSGRFGLLDLGLPRFDAWVYGYFVLNAFSAALIQLVSRRQLLPRLFEGRFLSFLGRVSYGAYIVHFPLTGLSGQLRERLAEHPAVPRLAAAGAGFLLNALLTFSLAGLSYRWLETPFLRLKDRVWPDAARTAPRAPAR